MDIRGGKLVFIICLKEFWGHCHRTPSPCLRACIALPLIILSKTVHAAIHQKFGTNFCLEKRTSVEETRKIKRIRNSRRLYHCL